MRVEFLVVTTEHGSLSSPYPPFEKREGWGSLVIGPAKMGQPARRKYDLHFLMGSK
jgi:hypothetical protein